MSALEVALVPPGTQCGVLLPVPHWPYVQSCTRPAAGALTDTDYNTLANLTGYDDGHEMCDKHLSEAAKELGKTWPATGEK